MPGSPCLRCCIQNWTGMRRVCWMKKARLAESTVTSPVLPHPSTQEEATVQAVYQASPHRAPRKA